MPELSQIPGLLSAKMQDTASDIATKVSDWVDDAPKDSTEQKVKLFIVTSGLILLGAMCITGALFAMHFLSFSHGAIVVNPSSFSFNFMSTPMLLAGSAAIALGLHFFVSRATKEEHKETTQKLVKTIALIGLLFFTACFTWFTFGNGFTLGMASMQGMFACFLLFGTLGYTADKIAGLVSRKRCGH